jgi:hypothetical protein
MDLRHTICSTMNTEVNIQAERNEMYFGQQHRFHCDHVGKTQSKFKDTNIQIEEA